MKTPIWNESSARLLFAQLLCLILLVSLSVAFCSLTLDRLNEIRLASSIQNEMEGTVGDSTSISEEIGKIERRLAAATKKSDLTLEDLNRISSEVGITILRMVGPDETQASTKAADTYQVAYRGNIESILNFLARIESGFICNIQEAALSAPNQNSSSVELDLVLEVSR